MKKRAPKTFIGGVFVGAFAVGLFGFFIAHAFNGPTNAPGVGNGALGVDTANDISVGTSSPVSGVKVLFVGSTTDSTAYALQVQASNATPLLYIRDDGAIGIATTTMAAGTVTDQGNLYVSGNVTCGGTCSGSVSAANVSGDVFGRLVTGGNYAFPASLGINTSSQATLPQALSVYGGGYFSGSLQASNIYATSSAVYIGSNAGAPGVTDNSSNTAIGANSMTDLTSGGAKNTAIGAGDLKILTTGTDNVAIGVNVQAVNQSGIDNIGIGNTALAVMTSTVDNIAIGVQALTSDTTGSSSVAIGTGALDSQTTGDHGTAIGYKAGFNDVTGSDNVFLGYLAGFNEAGSNKLYIANSTSTPLIYGDFSTGQVGINTASLSGALNVGGNELVNGNVTTTNLTISGLGSTGNPCLTIGFFGVVATGTCGGGGVTGGQNNYIPLWTGASTLGTSTLQENGTTTYTLQGFTVGTSSGATPGSIYITGNYLGGNVSAGQVTSNAFAAGNYAFPSDLNVGTTSTAGVSTLSVYGTELVTGLTTFSGPVAFNGTSTHTATSTFASSTVFTGSVDASGGSTFKVPVAANPTVNASGSIAYSTTNDLLVTGDGNVTGTIPRLIYFKALAPWVSGGGSASDTVTSAQASNTEVAYTTSFTIPANFLIQNKTLELSAAFQFTEGTPVPSSSFKVELRKAGVATTTIYSSPAGSDFCTSGATCSGGFTLDITALGVPASNASILTSYVGGAGTAASPLASNKTLQPQAVDTTAAEILQVTNTFAANTVPSTSSLIMYKLMEVN